MPFIYQTQPQFISIIKPPLFDYFLNQISYRMDLKHRISNLMVGSVQNQLDVLSLLLRQVYLPLEGKNAETRKNLEKFISHISHTSVQVSGTVSIELPIVAIGDDIERDIQDQELMNNYAMAMESWTNTIIETIKRENQQRKRTSQTALAQIELWRSRSASYSNLIQQLSHKSVQVIQSRLEAYCKTENGLGNSVAQEFSKQMKLLSKLTSQAKENVKFLTTLERQFKNLASQEGFHIIQETIPSLMNGLKMVWIISRNYKNSEKMQELISLITDQIADKVQNNIQISKLFLLSEKAESQLQFAKELIIQGKAILESWDAEFQRTQTSMDDEQLERWEFQPAPLVERCKYMVGILRDLLEITSNMKKFLVFLGPNLKSVTGNSQGIDKLTLEVKELVMPFRTAKENFFRKENHQIWGRLFNAFIQRQKQLEINTMKLIDDTFKDLRSSQGAFDLLNNFKNIDTLPQISTRLQQKYTDVLKSYRKELVVYRELFSQGKASYEEGKVGLVISRGKPPVAGIISWAKSLMARMKGPIVKFNKNQDKFQKQLFEQIKKEYLDLVKEIDLYQQNKYATWSNNIMQRAMQFLKEKILVKVGENHYQVNFRQEFRVLIQQAKQLEKMNHNISKAIVNIALQEKEYYRYIDKLKTMLREYYQSVHSLNPIQKRLLQTQIGRLNKVIEQGHESKNLSSLGINDFIDNCRAAIKSFCDIKKKVAKSSGMIQDIVRSIEEAVILKDFDFQARKQSPLSPSQFSSYSDEHMNKTIGQLSQKYKIIGDQFLKSIQEFVLGTSSKSSPIMKEYYYYWQRRIYNALFKMILRALISFKALVYQPVTPSGKCYPLFQIKANYQHPYFTTNPTYNELYDILNNIPNNIIASTKNFWRWMDGTCQFCKPGKGPNDEVLQKHTFHTDIQQNNIIIKVKFLLGLGIKKANDRARKFREMFEPDPETKDANKENPMWDPKHKLAVEKLKDKNPPTSLKYLEPKMASYKNQREIYKNMPKEKIAFFFSMTFTSVIHTFKTQADSWVERYGSVLREIANRDLESAKKFIADFDNSLEENPANIQELKSLLNKISEIKTISMMMEFRIADIVEKYRTILTYKQPIDQKLVQEAFKLENEWAGLVMKAKKKDISLNSSKQLFAKETQEEVAEFKKGLVLLHKQYKEEGPSAPGTNLDDGLRLIDYYKERILELNRRKEELVLAQKLFNLDISNFPELVAIDVQNKQLQPLYDLYREVKNTIKEYSSMLWMKLDAELLRKSFDKLFLTMKRKLSTNYQPNSLGYGVYTQLNDRIVSFKNSIPLIEQLKNPSVADRHWQKLVKLTGSKWQASVKTMTLDQVFALKLQRYEEEVLEIVNEAVQEFKNQEELNKIEQVWKKENFDLAKYKKGNQDRGWILTNTDQKKLLLEDQLANLQTVASSKYAGAFNAKIRYWQRGLNLISECIEVWLQVQKKWMYLEGIFIGNEDIKQQLKEESKKFQKNNLAFKKIMEHTYKTPNIFAVCVQYQGKLTELKTLSQELDRRQKSLSEYLDSKRFVFSRFYFLSDEYLLAILGSSDPEAVQPHMLKLFDNCKELLMSKSKQVLGMESDQSETFNFKDMVKPDDSPVEIWMTRVDLEMKKTLHRIMKESVFRYGNQERIQWVLENLGMIAIAGTQIWWTWRVQDVFDKVRGGNKYAMKQQSAKQTKDLNDLIDLVRTELNSKDRKKVNSLIIIDVHARDIVDRFVKDSILDKREFEWQSQLRFYWNSPINDIRIQQCTGNFSYGYEYEGLNGRLVITPLTDRCVMTLTTALTFKLGGSPAGPAGTGKTQTVKDLAKSLAIRCCVTNCGQGLDYEAMGGIFSGLVMTGFWGCFDEFNRITPQVLSVVSVQLKTIQNALINQKKTVQLLKKELNIKSTVGIFVTMNPGYAGRTQLPDNVKALFRPVTMIVPDLNIICEIMLMSQGFNEARTLAKKMTVLYKLASQQLSKQYHYDFQLRALKSVLVMAGQLKREDQTLPEEDTLMRALRDMNMPKFVYDDVPLFKGLIGDLFPGMDPVRKPYEKKDKIIEICESLGLQKLPQDVQVDKVVQLFETMGTRHTTMVVGPTGAGKSSVIEVLKKVQGAVIYTINPKSITVSELYGEMHSQTREWTDGLLSKTFRTANEKAPGGKEEPRWILYDGDVDAVWVENMNSVMDDNRLLTLINGDRIRLEKFCKMLFEVADLQYASPATISRCGMVYVDPRNLGYEPYWRKWMLKFTKNKEKFPEFITTMDEVYPRYIPILMARIFDGVDREENLKPLEFTLPRTNLNLLVQLTRILDSLLNIQNLPDPDKLESIFIYATVWGLGACLTNQSKKIFEDKLRSLVEKPMPDKKISIFDFYFDMKREWVNWKDEVRPYETPEGIKYSKILVPTVDTKKYSYILDLMVKNKFPCIFVGESGTAKSVIISNYLGSLSQDLYMKLEINFSSRTTSKDLQANLEDNIDKRSGRIFGPKILGKQLIIMIDDLHMPKVDTYGTQQPIALLKFFIEKGYIYERVGGLQQKIIKDTQVVSALLPPSVATMVDPRLLSLYTTYNLIFPSQDNLQRIYNTILSNHLKRFSSEIQETTSKLTECTLKLYRQIVELLPRTPVKFHYIFNLRDLSRIYEGLTRATVDKFTTKESIIRLWRNQCTRVFGDRLINEEDRNIVAEKLMGTVVKAAFEDSYENVMRNPLLFGDFLTANPTDETFLDPKLYQDCGTFQTVKKKFDWLLQEYNYDENNMEMNLVLFDDALGHLTKIYRIIRFPLGHALLVGFGGSGKQSLTKLALFTARYKLFSITLTRGYKEKQFREDLKNLLGMLTQGPVLFLFTDAHVLQQGFLELINNLLTIGMVPALFDQEEKKNMSDKIKDEAKRQGVQETKEDLWNYFVEKTRNNLHIVLAMSPAGNTLRIRCRNFPGLISSTSIDWFFSWPKEALVSVADFYLKDTELPSENRAEIINHIVNVHMSVQEYSQEFQAKLKRKNFATPKNYLDFLKTYNNSLEKLAKQFNLLVTRYVNGLAKLKEAKESVSILREDLQIKQKEVNAETKEVQTILAEIEVIQVNVEKNQTAAVAKEKELDVEVEQIQKQKAKADEILKNAEPQVLQAEKALNVVDSKELTTFKALAKPPQQVAALGITIMILKPTGNQDEKQGWQGVRRMIANPSSFINTLKQFGKRIGKVTKRQIDTVKERIDNKDFQFDRMYEISKSAHNLLLWLKAMVKLYDVHKEVEPLKKKVEEMERITKIKKVELEETKSLVKTLTEQLNEANENSRKKKTRLQELSLQARTMERRLNAAEKLLSGLGREEIRWSKDREILAQKIISLTGDCLTTSAFLSYTGPFNYEFRKRMIYEDWRQDIKRRSIPMSTAFRLQEILTNDVEIAKWASEELPSDELSVQNGILATKATRWPLCIDPQLQAANWIKKKYQGPSFKVLNMNQGASAFIKDLENTIKRGGACLFENIDQQLDPTLDPLLEKNIVDRAGQRYIKLTDNFIDYNDNFKLYFTTKLSNPKYTPQVMGKTMVINFTVTLMGLRDQLLNVVVSFEKPEKEKQRKELVHQMSQNRKKLKEKEDELLRSLSESSGSLLDNEPLIMTLESTKKVSTEIAQDIEKGQVTAQEIQMARQSYTPVARRGAVLFFSMCGLSSISQMYQYSLASYLTVFNNSLRDAKKDPVLETRLRAIIDKLTLNVYEYTCLGIFQVHKLMFSFHMTIMINQEEFDLNRTQLNFFLKGNQSLTEIQKSKPYKWIPQQGWRDLQMLVTIGPEYKKMIEDLENNEKGWKKWYDVERPESEQLPQGYNKLSPFQILLILRVYRPDRVVNGMKRFIIDAHKSDKFVQPPTVNYEKIFKASSEKSPIVFILSPGADPLSDVQKLADDEGFSGNKFKYLSLGQGMEKQANIYLSTSSNRGHWLMLQNCHLLANWLKDHLQKFLETLSRPNKDFRLWLTTQPTDAFPLGILQKALKVVTEPPDGLKLNMRSTLSKLSEQSLNQCPHQAFKPLVFVVSFFHAIVQDRRKYGKIGWNIPYDFNQSDFSISYKLLNMYLTKAFENKDQAIPWNSLKYLIGEAMYGGRVTDDWDRRVLMTYLEEYMGDFLFDKNRKFFFAKTPEYDYAQPPTNSLQAFLNSVNQLPLINSPIVFGLNPNAEITYFTNSAKLNWENLLLMQFASASIGGGMNREQMIQATANDVLSKLPETLWEIGILRAECSDITPTTIVLFQELERFNNLIERMKDTLINLKRALKGEIGMSSELDQLAFSLQNSNLPARWAKLAPQTEKKLGSWMTHFSNRIKQYNQWAKVEEPAVMWLSGLHIPEAYLTALVQTSCRIKGWALDKSTLYTVVTQNRNPDFAKKKPEHGCYLQGFYLEGASWDIEKGQLIRQQPKQLICEMPIIQIIPAQASKLKIKDNLKTPVYVTQNRKNAMGVGQVFVADLRTPQHPSHWVLQGVALVLNVDY